MSEEEVEGMWESRLSDHARHHGTRVIPIFVMSLTVGTERLAVQAWALMGGTESLALDGAGMCISSPCTCICSL